MGQVTEHHDFKIIDMYSKDQKRNPINDGWTKLG